MKTLKQRPDLLIGILVPLIFILGLAYYTQPAILHYLYYLNWTATLGCIAVILLPNSKKILGESASLTTVIKRYSITWITQLLLVLSFITICHLINNSQSSTNPASLQIYQLGHQFWTQYGLYPWTAYSLIAICIAWLGYNKNISATFSVATMLPNSQNNQTIGIIINGAMRNICFLSLSLTLTAVIIIITNLFYQGIVHVHPGWNSPQIGCCIFLIISLLIINKKKLFQNQFFKRYSLFHIIFVFSLASSLLIGLVFGIINIIGFKSFQAPSLLLGLTKQSWNTAWHFTANLWWLSWTPLITIQLAKQCHGLSIRNSIIMLLSLPLISSALFYGLPHSQETIAAFNQIFTSSHFYLTLSLIATTILLFILTSKKNRHAIVNTSLPLKGKLKYRPFTHAQQNTVGFSLVFLTLYCIGGCHLLNLFLVIFISPCIIYSNLVALSWIYHTRQNKKNTTK